jgi:NhaP-type Na+/H+ or K+/H+ antiporter
MTALYIAGIGLCALLAQWLAWVARVPAILFLLVTGLLLGPVFSVVDPDAIFGDLLFPIISLSVAVILFEGSLTLHFKELKGIGNVVRNLCSIGMIATAIIIGYSCYWLLGVDWRIAAVVGAVLVVTGPTVTAPLLNAMRPTEEIDRILRWEGIVIDPIGALFAVLVFEAVMLSGHSGVLSHTLIALVTTVGLGLSIGIAAGYITNLIIQKEWLPYNLQKFGVLSFVLISFTISNAISHESGLLAVTVFGIYLANQDDLELDSILEFKEDLSQILISVLFILLAARLELSELLLLGPNVVIFMLIVLFVARPICIALSTYKSNLNWRAKTILSWIAPRGIVAAAVGSVFALSMSQAGIQGADKIVPIIFLVIIVTVVLQSLTAIPLAKLLKIRQKRPSTVIIIGANHVARAIAKVLQEQEVDVYLSDPAWENCRLARMVGLKSYFGNPQAAQAERFLPMSNLKTLIGLSPNRHNNALGVQYFSHILGEKNVYSLKSSSAHSRANNDSLTFLSRQNLFGANVSFSVLSNLIAKGGKVSATKLAEAFTWDNYLEVNKEAIPLFVLQHLEDEDYVRVIPFTVNGEYVPDVGDMIIAMQPPKVTMLK